MTSLLDRVGFLVAPPFCWGCGALAPAHAPLCRSCRLELRWLGPEPVDLDGLCAWAPLAYDGPARSLVRGLKYRGAPSLAEPMAAAIAAGVPAAVLAPGDALVAVPMHPGRLRKRGFNQAERIAAALARRRGLELTDCLRRHGRSAHQVGRDRRERLEGQAGAFMVPPGAVPRRAVLVDDVITTGSTLRACAAALRGAGCEQVTALAYARTPGR